MVLVGDARGKVAILVDDMADTCGTIVQVPQFCLEYLVLVLVLVFPSLLTTSDTCSIIARNISLCLRSWSWCQLGWQDEDQDQQHYHFGLCPLMSALFSVFILALTIPPITCTTDNKSQKKLWSLILLFAIDKHCLQAAQKLVEDGATKIYAILTHGIFRWSLMWF